MSHRGHQKSFSREGFQPLTHENSTEPNDITIDIPMTRVTTGASPTGARRPDGFSPARPTADSDEPEQFDEKRARRFHRSTRGRRRRPEKAESENQEKQDGTLNSVGRFYKKIYNASVITRYFIYVAPPALIIAIPIVIGATVAPNAHIGGVQLMWFFSWIEVVWVSLWVSKLLARFLPRIFQFLSGVVSTGTRKYALIIRALEIPLSLVGWAVASLTTFVPLMTLNPDQRASGDTGLTEWETIVKNILFACVFSTLVLLGEKLIIQLLSISYHRKQFDDRIKESKRNIYLVGLLYDASRNLFPMYCPEFIEEDYLINDVLDLASTASKRASIVPGHKRSGSATPMRLIQNVARVGDKVTAAFGNVAQEITGKKVFNPTASHSIVVQALEKKHSAEALARRLWMSFVLEGKEALSLNDIMDVLGDDREDEANEAFEVLDVDGNGDISLDEMLLRVTQFGRERRSIASSMHDVDQAIHVLDNLLCAVVFIVVIFIFVAWLNKNFTTTLATAGTALLSMSFVFAATAQEVLGSCIFLFVKHPFDVGDRVDIADVHYVVERMSLLYTVFRRVKDQKRTQVPNIILNSNWIDNVSRSKAMREQILLYVNFDTTFEDLDMLKKEMVAFVRDKDNARDFQPDVDIEVTGVAEMNKMELKIEIRHKSNWANEAVRAARRSKFMCALVLAIRRVPLYGPGMGCAPAGDKANPTYSVTISDADAKLNKDLFDRDQDGKRLVPLLPENQARPESAKTEHATKDRLGVSTSTEPRETAAVESLIKRHVAVDPQEPLDQHRELAINKQRSNDVQEVRDILRRESTTGRRRGPRYSGGSLGDATRGRAGSRSIPSLAVASPGEPIGAPHPSRVSYFEDTHQPSSFNTTTQEHWATELPPLPYYYSPPNPAQQPQPLRPETPPNSSLNRPVPGNAFSHQASSSPGRHDSRLPVPGMTEMKRSLQQQGSPPPPK